MERTPPPTVSSLPSVHTRLNELIPHLPPFLDFSTNKTNASIRGNNVHITWETRISHSRPGDPKVVSANRGYPLLDGNGVSGCCNLKSTIFICPGPPQSQLLSQLTMSQSQSQRVILITGASAGIGRSCAIGLSKAFPSPEHPEQLVLVLVGRRQEELEKTGKSCREGTVIEIGTGDVGKEEDVERIFGVVKQKYGRLDLLFNVSLPTGPRRVLVVWV